ncbi:hypothetical protein JZ751_009858 [Albula glossodonta]|uniref:Uncharacterized protein n=1 Tax=Albula glossodonta TaxID=121402 RepID=A0A8T2P6T3_9TELE|nr:hypothetical protein JZ751_009858 [Albula glossodonta]
MWKRDYVQQRNEWRIHTHTLVFHTLKKQKGHRHLWISVLISGPRSACHSKHSMNAPNSPSSARTLFVCLPPYGQPAQDSVRMLKPARLLRTLHYFLILKGVRLYAQGSGQALCET